MALTATKRLARTDVALQQAMHRMHPGQVGLDLGDHPLLGARQLVRQRVAQPVDQLAGDVVADAQRLALERPLAHDQHGLHPQQLVERQPSASPCLVGHRLGQVDEPQRVGAIEQAQPLLHRPRHRVGDAPSRAALERVLDEAGDLPRGERHLLALRVDRHDAAGAVADEVDDRVGHLQPAAVHLGLAEQRDVQPFVQLLLAPWLVEEGDGEPAAAVADHRGDHRLAVAGDPLGDAAHGDEHQRLLARLEVAHPRLVGAVDPTPRVEGQEVEDRRDAERLQRRLLALADTAQPFDADARRARAG